MDEDKTPATGLKWVDPIYASDQRLVDRDGRIVGWVSITSYGASIAYRTNTGHDYIDAESARKAVVRAAIGEAMP